MKIIFRFLLKNIREKKLRSLLVVGAIMVATALFFASSALKSNIEVELRKIISKSSGEAEITISPERNSPSPFFRMNMLSQIMPRVEYAVGLIDNIAAVYKTETEEINFTLSALDTEAISTLYSIEYAEIHGPDSFYGRKIILPRSFAEEHAIACNDIIKMEINGRQERLQVAAIALSTGLFRDDGYSNIAIIPLSLVAKAFNQLGKVNRVYIKINPGESVQKLITDISKLYPRYTVKEAVDRQELKRFSSEVTLPYNVMLVLVILTSVYIIFTSFQVITKERLPVIGTFRSIGATKRATSWLFYLESILYGILGGIVGIVLGIGVLYIMGYSTAKSAFGLKTYTMYFNMSHVISAFVLAIVISFISALVPIRSLRKIPARDIILGTISESEGKHRLKIIFGLLIVIISVIVPQFMHGPLTMIVNITCILLSVFGLVFFSPVLIRLFTNLFTRPFAFAFGNIGTLAVKNLKANHKMHNNIALLTIGLSSLIMISTINESIGIEVLQVYSRARFEVMSWIWPMNRQLESKLRSVEGIKQTLGSYNLWNIPAKGKSYKILNIQGIDTRKYLDFWDYPVEQQMLDTLDKGRYAITGYGLKAQLRLKKGDDLEVLLNNTWRTYKIIGFFNTMWMNGRTMIVADKYLKLDAAQERYGQLFIQSSQSQQDTAKTLKRYFSRVRPWVETLDNLRKRDLESNSQMMTMLAGFSVLTMVIVIIGIINNFLLAFLDRKHNLAIFKSQGMSARQMVKMIFVESLAEGVLGALIGLCGGVLMLIIIPGLLVSMELYLPLHFSLLLFLTYAGVAVMITLLASVSPALKSSKLNTLQALKYE
ncbi:MAG: FtsX-like permease family protein [Spirochaetales bacterium]|nr:FtsX-like permease family protein [Spirochaetales bacterium]